MSLKILIAGCLPRDRREIEGLVKKAFGNIPESDPWNVSLVKMGNSWSISLEGESQVLSLTAPEDRLQETIAKALGANGTASQSSLPLSTLEESEAVEGLLTLAAEKLGRSPGTARPTYKPAEGTDRGDRYDCSACGRPFRVIYTARPRETKINAPAACPHCWHLAKVSVPESAAANEEYRTEAVST